MLDSLLRMRVFVAVYEEASFTAAASRENVTQSGVTQHVQKLEDYFEVRLFERGGGKVLPTPAADLYYSACVRVLRLHQESRNALRSCRDELAGLVLVGLTPALTRAVLAPALAAFMREHPNVRVRVMEADEAAILQKVRAGDLDFGVVPAVRGGGAATRHELFVRTPEFLVSGRRSMLGLRHGCPVKIAELGPLSLVVPSSDQPRRAALEDYLTCARAEVCRRVEVDTALGALDFVAHTDWVTLLPAVMLLREVDDADFIVNPLADPGLDLDLYRVERARELLSTVAAAFEHTLRTHAALMATRARALAMPLPDPVA